MFHYEARIFEFVGKEAVPGAGPGAAGTPPAAVSTDPSQRAAMKRMAHFYRLSKGCESTAPRGRKIFAAGLESR